MTETRARENIIIAVLAPQLDTVDQRARDLFDGIMDDFIINLSRFIGVSVISSISTRRVDPNDLHAVEQLGAEFWIASRIRDYKGNLRINIQLINAKDGGLVHALQYDNNLSEVISVIDTVLEEVVHVLQQEVNFEILSHSYKKNSDSLDAYENWLRGMEALKEGSMEGDLEARNFFNSSLAIEPRYAKAYAGLSLSYFNELSCRLWDRWEESMEGAHSNALKAVEIDEKNYRALAILGRTYLFKGDFDQAEFCIRKSLQMNPNDASNMILVAFTMMYLGHNGEAVELYEKALKINPLHKEKYLPYGASFLFEKGEFEKSIDLFEQTDQTAYWVDYPAYAASAYFHCGRMEEMQKSWDIFLELFQKHIQQIEGSVTDDGLTLDKRAIQWQKIINPYKGKSYMEPLWDHLLGHATQSAPVQHEKGSVESAPPPVKNRNRIIHQADVWELHFEGKTIVMKDAKGLQDLQLLLCNPSKEFHCMDLMNAAVDESHQVQAVDETTLKQVYERIKELQEEIEQAEIEQTNQGIESLREEYESLLGYVSSALAKGGKTRTMDSTLEKARSAATWRIRTTIKKISEKHKDLGNHLKLYVKTGVQCVYQPLNKVSWSDK